MVKYIIFALFFAAASAAPHKSGFVCPVGDIAATGCKGPKDCLYPNPESCNNYIQCTVDANGITGTPVVMPCAPANPPLEWNDDKKECDFAPSSTCGRVPTTAQPTETPTEAPTDAPTTTQGPTETPTQTPTETPTQTPTETPTQTPTETPTPTPTEASTETPTEEPTEAPTTTQVPTGTPVVVDTTTTLPTAAPAFVCPVEDIAATGCKGPEDCLYPNPESCNNFIQCTVNADGVNGTPVVMPCAPANPPLEWNNDKKQCGFAPSPTCKRV